MKSQRSIRTSLALGVVGLLLAAGAWAQAGGKGALYGTATSAEGELLPGVTVTLSGVGAPQIAVTDSQGAFRFLQLDAGDYSLRAVLSGFSTLEYPDVKIAINRNTTLALTLSAQVEEIITVTAETPILDERKFSQTTTITRLELDKIPTARDPWSIASQAPGVIVDRVNVGGNESGQQSNFIGTGSFREQNKFLLDGADVGDQSAQGASATYFGFEQFEQMQLSTGGTDITIQTPGVQVNLVTKRGTNEWRGSASYLQTPDDLQSTPELDLADFPSEQIDDARNPDTGAIDAQEFTGNQIETIETYGLEVGGPVVKDRVFIWGAYDFQNIDQNAFGGGPDDTDLENWAIKANAQIVDSNSLEVSYNRGEKVKTGRGAGPSRPPETTWNQGGPSPVSKVEDTHIVNPNLYLTGHWSKTEGGFFLEPQGGREVNQLTDADGVYGGSYRWLETDRPSYRWEAGGSTFFNTGEVNHELKFGGSYRKASNFSDSGWPGTGDLTGAAFYAGSLLGLDDGQARIRAWRTRSIANEAEYQAAWLQDTVTFDNLTINGGLRFDVQEGRNLASSAPAGPLEAFGGLPALAFEGNSGSGVDPNTGAELAGFEWQELSPRVGVTYALGAERDTLLRASYSRFNEQLGTGHIERVNPNGFARADFNFEDLNGNLLLDDNERDSLELVATVGFDPNNPFADADVTDPDLEAVTHDELNLGIEHSLTPSFVIGLTGTYRVQSDILETRTLVREEGSGLVRVAEGDDWVQQSTVSGNLPDGTPFERDVYGLREGLSATGGQFLTNGDRETDYLGVSFTFTRRLADRWMLRGNATWNDWTWDIPDSFFRYDDPTDALDNNTSPQGGYPADNDGAVVTQTSTGSGNVNVFMNSRWAFNVNGLYQVAPNRPWGFNVAANIGGREGFPLAFFQNAAGRGNGLPGVAVQATDSVDSVRLDDLYTVDLRLDKDFTFQGVNLTLSLDGFNLLNEATVLQRRNNLTANPSWVDQTLGPRVFRVGVKLSYK